MDKFCKPIRSKVAASAAAIGVAASSVAWINACPAILEAPKPLAAICAVAARKAPAAQGGGLPASKLDKRLLS